MSAPRPGRPVRGSTTGRPLMAALDLLGRRWALRCPVGVAKRTRRGTPPARAMRKALLERALRTTPRSLQEAGLVQRDGQQWALTALGTDLDAALAPLEAWSRRWANSVR